jgi:hypothetical protein
MLLGTDSRVCFLQIKKRTQRKQIIFFKDIASAGLALKCFPTLTLETTPNNRNLLRYEMSKYTYA